MDGVWGVAAVSYSTAFNPRNKEFVYSFAVSDSIYTFDPATGKQKAFYAASRYVDEPILPMSKPDNAHDLEYALETPYYHAVIYDEYRDVYYRFVRHSIPFKDEITGERHEFYEKPISIIVLDKNMKIIGETKLAEHLFLDYIYYVTDRGLYISTGNPGNEELAEDKAGFIGFTLNTGQ